MVSSASPGRQPAGGRFAPVLLILSPPRCGSTALARAFWQHPAFRWYVHEPYDRVYHHAGDQDTVTAAFAGALDSGRRRATGLVVKEMTFQAGPAIPDLIRAATVPVVLLVRDPRLAIRSRMRQRARTGQAAEFPHRESGWPDLAAALTLARGNPAGHLVVEFTQLRNRPAQLLPALCERLGLPYSPDMLSWPSRPDIALGQLGGEQREWYGPVLASTGFEGRAERIPAVDGFPHGMRQHVRDCLHVYREALAWPHRLAAVGS